MGLVYGNEYTSRELFRKRLKVAELSGAARFMDGPARVPKGTVVFIEAVVAKKLQHNPMEERLVDARCSYHSFVR